MCERWMKVETLMLWPIVLWEVFFKLVSLPSSTVFWRLVFKWHLCICDSVNWYLYFRYLHCVHTIWIVAHQMISITKNRCLSIITWSKQKDHSRVSTCSKMKCNLRIRKNSFSGLSLKMGWEVNLNRQNIFVLAHFWKSENWRSQGEMYSSVREHKKVR